MKQKFQMDKYFDDLQNVEEKLNRFKSQKENKMLRREGSSKYISTFDQPTRITTNTRPLVIEKTTKAISKAPSYAFEEPQLRIKSQSKYDRLDRDVAFYDTNSTLPTKAAQHSIEQEQISRLKAQKEAVQRKLMAFTRQKKSSALGEEPTPYTPSKQVRQVKEVKQTKQVKQTREVQPDQEQQIFLRQANQLYNYNRNSPLDLLIAQLRRRDSVYKVVEERFEGENPTNYKKLLENLIKREELLTKIVTEFKNMSKIQIEDLTELLYFIKNQ